MQLSKPRIASRFRGRVVVAESNESHRQRLVHSLGEWGYEPVIACDHNSLLAALEHDGHTPVFLDLNFGSNNPMAAYGQLLLDGFAPRVIFLGDDARPQIAQRALKMGALAFLERASDPAIAKKTLDSVMNSSPNRMNGGSALLGNSSAIKELRDMIRSVAVSDAAVMILGESGTGKELVARAIHDCSHRAAEEFVPVNMGGLPENLVESILFGHEKGAFTGADQAQAGLCEFAHNGTLFLDEIGEMSRDLQPKLLRFLQNHSVQRVGSTQIKKVDSRIISATNRTIDELVGTGLLREDLYFRLYVIPITVPPLRERVEDIPLLAAAFLIRKCRQMRRQLLFSDECLELLCQYNWPGNIRQLENFVERMMVLAKGDVIEAKALPREWFSSGFSAVGAGRLRNPVKCDPEERVTINDRQLTRMESAERNLIIDALHRHDGIVSHAARFLGLGPATIYRKIRSLEIPKSVVRRDKE